MIRKTTVLCAILTLFPCLYSGFASIDANRLSEIPNAVVLDEDIIGSGAPGEQGLLQAKDAGIKTVIDLRTSREGTFAEQKAAESMGLNYHNIEVSADNLSLKQMEQMNSILMSEENLPVLLHCASGNRVGALWALYLNKYRGYSEEDALQEAEQKILKSEKYKSKAQSLMGN